MGSRTYIISALFIFLVLQSAGQEAILKGKVLDESGSPVEEVSVFSINQKIGTITDEQGIFYLTLDKGNLNIEFFAQGFRPELHKFTLSADTTLSVQLMASSNMKGRFKSQLVDGNSRTDSRQQSAKLLKPGETGN